MVQRSSDSISHSMLLYTPADLQVTLLVVHSESVRNSSLAATAAAASAFRLSVAQPTSCDFRRCQRLWRCADASCCAWLVASVSACSRHTHELALLAPALCTYTVQMHGQALTSRVSKAARSTMAVGGSHAGCSLPAEGNSKYQPLTVQAQQLLSTVARLQMANVLRQ
jgi:hypothetical protein